MKLSPAPLLFAVAALAGFIAWRTHVADILRSSQTAALRLRRTESETRIAAMTDRLARAAKSSDEYRARLAVPSAEKPAPPPPATPARRDLSRLIDDSPELQNLQLASRRAQLEITYSPFYRAAGLTAEQIQLFEQNLLYREERMADLRASATRAHTDLRDPVYQKLYASIAADYDSAQRAALGEAGASQLADYERTAPARETVSALAGATAMAGLPLDAAQAEQLTRAIDAATLKPSAGSGWSAPTVDWRAVQEQAKAFLSSSQLTFIATTEAGGPRNSGGRFMPALHAAIDVAAREESAASNPAHP